MPPNKRFNWYEPTDFVRARAKAERPKSRLTSFVMASLVFTVLFALFAWPDSFADFGVIALLTTTVTFLITYPLPIFLAELPHSVTLNEKMIIISNEPTKLADIKSAIIGACRIGETDFPALRFQTVNQRSFVVGLASKIDPIELSRALEEFGVHVE